MSAERLLVIGSGIAGLTTALAARARGIEVTVVTKAALGDSSTSHAQGGIAAVVGEGAPDSRLADSVASHVADTLSAGAGLSEPEAAEVVCADGANVVADLLAAGMRLDTDGSGVLERGLEAAHSHPRILHADGDATGAAISRALIARAREAGVHLREQTIAAELVLEAGRASGVRLLEGPPLTADAVVLATGGAGHLYPRTTNPAVATGDGLALALRAGATLVDLEFVQFHPTALAAGEAAGADPLISEAVRGEGAVLRDHRGTRFMTAVHPDAELAPRDVVARAIARRMRETGAPVLLDVTHLGAAFLARRFPSIDATVRAYGLDWSAAPVPVAPAAHYLMGGVATDSWGRTTVPGLLAVGEVACTGLHGANRLASNSLLEGAVLGRRAVEALDAPWPTRPPFAAEEPMLLPAPAVERPPGARETVRRDELRALLWEAAGLERDAAGLRTALARLDSWAPPAPRDRAGLEDGNLLLTARALVRAALAREESRGAHWRADFPGPAPTPRHSAVRMTPAPTMEER